MKKIKQIFYGFIILCLLCGSISAAASEQKSFSYEKEGRHTFEKLTALGILDEDEGYESGVEVSRGEFTRLAMKLCKDMANIYKTEEAFADVNPSLEDAEYILAAYALGYVSGGNDGNFYPGRVITCAEALKLTLCAVGYGGYSENNGGYPSGYISTASKIDLLKGLEFNGDKPVTWDYAMLLLENAIEVDVVKTVISGNSTYEEIVEGRTLLEEEFSVYKVKSVIEANIYTDLMSADSEIANDTVIADGKSYEIGNTDANEYLGMRMEMYYFDDEEGMTPRLLYITPDEDKNNILEIAPEDIYSLEDNQLLYNDGSGKKRTAKLNKNATLIWNGKMAELSEEKLMPECGTVMLISNDGDLDYDVIQVMSYEPYVVSSVSDITKTVGTKQEVSLELDEGESSYFTIIKSDGINVGFENIRNKQVILYAESEPKGQIVKTALLSSETVSGRVESLNAEDKKICIDGYEYDITSELAQTIRSGYEGTFYLDAFERIVYMDGVIDIVYGYLSRLYTETSGEIMCRIFTENGNWVNLQMKNKVKLNDDYMTAKSTFEELGAGNNRQLIRYLVNGEGKITKIETAKEIAMGSDEEKEAIKEDTFRLSASGSKTFRTSTNSFNGAVTVKDDAKIFIVPSGENGYNESEISLGSLSSLQGDMSYDFEAYNANSVRTSPVFVIYDYSKATLTEMLLVTETRGTILNSDMEVCPSIWGYWRGDELVMPVNLRSDSPVGDISEIQRGDVISFSYNDKGEMDYIQKRTESEYSLTGGVYSMVTFASGTVKSFDTDEKKAVIQYDTLGSSAVFSLASLGDVYIYDITNKEFSIGSIADLTEGDRICARIRNLVLMEMFVIRD